VCNYWSCKVVLVGLLTLLSAGGTGKTAAKQAAEASIGTGQHDAIWRTAGGQVILLPHSESLRALGLELRTLRQTAVSALFPQLPSVFAIEDGSSSQSPLEGGSTLAFITHDHGFDALLGGTLQTYGTVALVLADGSEFEIGDLAFHFEGLSDLGATATDRLNTGQEVFSLSSGLLQYDAGRRALEWIGMDVQLSTAWAQAAGIPQAAGATIASLIIEANAEPAPELAQLAASLAWTPRSVDGFPNVGPDVIVGVLNGVDSYGQVGGINAYSVGTTSCNKGDTPLNWISNTNQHPVIGQNMFRLKGGRFEQIGQSWLKHGFTALQGNDCNFGCDPYPNGTHLGSGCSDPYGSGLNGSQSGLGPKFEVNATTGIFLYPFTAQGQQGDAIYKRLQVKTADIDPNQNAGARYFVEGHYVTPDDAAAGNQDNNASYQEITVTNNPPTYTINLISSTMRETPALHAWQAVDPAVSIQTIKIPNDRNVELGYKVTDLGGGMWHYEYALYNVNSHRSARYFSVPIPSGVSVSNIGFHDVDYHSGEPFDSTDWTATVAGGSITWATQTFVENPNANALRWGTLYNFRFDANSPPAGVVAHIGLFDFLKLTSGPGGGGQSLVRKFEYQFQTGDFVNVITQGPS